MEEEVNKVIMKKKNINIINLEDLYDEEIKDSFQQLHSIVPSTISSGVPAASVFSPLG